MRRSVISFLLALLLAVSTAAQQQTAVVLRNVYLRLDSSTEQAPIRKLLPGERLTILDPAPDDGYYHAATDDREEGRVWGQNIRIEGPPIAAPAAAVVRAGAFDPNWAKTPPCLSSQTQTGRGVAHSGIATNTIRISGRIAPTFRRWCMT